jgi:iron complex transport system substrate-binding protein
MEALDAIGVHNVAADNLGPGGLVTISPEQLIAWQPDVIIAVDQRFYDSVGGDPLWQQVKAVKDKRIYLAPGQPFGWVDEPPAASRLIGLFWLGKMLYPELFPEDLKAESKRFYALFYHQEPSDAQLETLLAGSTPPR